MDLSTILGKAAPWLAAAAAGPAGLAGMAIKTVATALGSSAETSEELAAAVVGASPEQLAAVRAADADFQIHMQELGFKQITDMENLAVADRKSARDMQIANKSFMPALLSGVVLAGYFGVLFLMLSGLVPVPQDQSTQMMLGQLITMPGLVLAFWFGTTRGSEDKTRLLAQATPVKTD